MYCPIIAFACRSRLGKLEGINPLTLFLSFSRDHCGRVEALTINLTINLTIKQTTCIGSQAIKVFGFLDSVLGPRVLTVIPVRDKDVALVVAKVLARYELCRPYNHARIGRADIVIMLYCLIFQMLHGLRRRWRVTSRRVDCRQEHAAVAVVHLTVVRPR